MRLLRFFLMGIALILLLASQAVHVYLSVHLIHRMPGLVSVDRSESRWLSEYRHSAVVFSHQGFKTTVKELVYRPVWASLFSGFTVYVQADGVNIALAPILPVEISFESVNATIKLARDYYEINILTARSKDARISGQCKINKAGRMVWADLDLELSTTLLTHKTFHIIPKKYLSEPTVDMRVVYSQGRLTVMLDGQTIFRGNWS